MAYLIRLTAAAGDLEAHGKRVSGAQAITVSDEEGAYFTGLDGVTAIYIPDPADEKSGTKSK